MSKKMKMTSKDSLSGLPLSMELVEYCFISNLLHSLVGLKRGPYQSILQNFRETQEKNEPVKSLH